MLKLTHAMLTLTVSSTLILSGCNEPFYDLGDERAARLEEEIRKTITPNAEPVVVEDSVENDVTLEESDTTIAEEDTTPNDQAIVPDTTSPQEETTAAEEGSQETPTETSDDTHNEVQSSANNVDHDDIDNDDDNDNDDNDDYGCLNPERSALGWFKYPKKIKFNGKRACGDGSTDVRVEINARAISQWWYTLEIVITNHSKDSFRIWDLEFDFDQPINDMWEHGHVKGKNKNHYTIQPNSWNTAILPGRSVIIVFNGAPQFMK